MQIVDSKDQVLRLGMDRLQWPAPACNTTLGLGFDSVSSVQSTVSPGSTALLVSIASPLSKVSHSMASTPLNRVVPTMASHDGLGEGCVRPSPPVQLELLPLHPTRHLAVTSSSTWQSRFSGRTTTQAPRGFDVNQIPSSVDCDDVAESSPNSVFTPFPMDCARRTECGLPVKREREKLTDTEQERTCEVSSRGSDEEEAGGTRKKLRLSKEQSALLEESFKDHSTLNPKQKNALAKQLNLRPRQVEVWFQNRRARTKLKQTEVDCELLKRCCESLTEENRRLQKEVQELRAIKVAPPCVISHDFYMPLPAATLTMCPSCERLATLDNRTLGFAKPQLPPHYSQPSAAC